jgi:hypothetical protein
VGQQPAEHERPAFTLRGGEVPGRRDERRELVVGHRVCGDAEGREAHRPWRAFAVGGVALLGRSQPDGAPGQRQQAGRPRLGGGVASLVDIRDVASAGQRAATCGSGGGHVLLHGHDRIVAAASGAGITLRVGQPEGPR